MLSNKEVRARARADLGGSLFANNWLMTLVVMLVCEAALGFTSYTVVVALLLSGPLAYATARITISTARGKEAVDFNDLLCGFKEDFGNTIILGLIRDLFVFLWALLFIIPGIVKAYSYSMAYFIQQDSDNKEWEYCLDESKKLMDGNKMKLFLLDLSFIGWYILGALAFGVGTLWVSAYHAQSRAEFFKDITGGNVKVEDVPEISEEK